MKKSKTKTKRGNSKNAPIGVTRGANALFTVGACPVVYSALSVAIAD